MNSRARLFVSAVIALGALFTIGTVTAPAAVPSLINYQGILKNPGGTPQVGTFTVTFTIYPVPAGGSVIWSEAQSVTTNAAGLFNVLLGSVTPITDAVFGGADRYLSIAVSPDPEMTPRTAIVAVAYAYRIATVDGASGGTITSKVSIGPGHTNTGSEGFVAGESNSIAGDYGVVSGGQNNTVSGSHAAVGGGTLNRADGASSAISGGGNNTIESGSVVSTISGGSTNTITAGVQCGTIGGGLKNCVSAFGATVSGGQEDTASQQYATIGGGLQNAARGFRSLVAGGWLNRANGDNSTIAGGYYNFADSTGSTIGGGEGNLSTGPHSTVSGGRDNAARGGQSFVGGGHNNLALGQNSVIAGGDFNEAGSSLSSVGGGDNNIIGSAAHYSTIPGGSDNFIRAAYSFAAGRNTEVRVAHGGSFLWADSLPGTFQSANANEFAARATGGVRFITATSPFVVGAQLVSGSGSWSSVSDRNAKEHFAPVNGKVLLDKLAAIPVTSWNYKTQDPSIRHIGPMAQDFSAAFGVGEDEKHITAVDADGVALVAIQALYQQQKEANQELQAQIAELREMIRAQASKQK